MNTNEERKKCNRCKVNLTLDKFTKKRDDTYQKQCIECCAKQVKLNNKCKCPHGKRKSRCVDCGGGSICIHGIIKYFCKDCGGGGVCIHGKQKSRCVDCDGGSICEHGKQRTGCTICNKKHKPKFIGVRLLIPFYNKNYGLRMFELPLPICQTCKISFRNLLAERMNINATKN